MAQVWGLLVLLSTLWTFTAAQSGVSIRLMDMEVPIDIGQVCVTNIGQSSDNPTEAGDALVCVTTYARCCRGADREPDGAVGEWSINGTMIPGLTMMPNATTFRNRGTGLVRLNVRTGHTETRTGTYCCEIPDSSGVTQTLCVQGVTDDEVCNPSTAITATTATTAPSMDPSSPTSVTDPATSTQSNNTDPSPPASPAGLGDTGAIVGGIVGGLVVVVLVVILVVVLLCFLLKRKKNKTYNTRQLQTVVLEDKHKESAYYNPTSGNIDTPLDGEAAYTEVEGGEHTYSTVDESKNGSVAQLKSTKRENYEQLDDGGRNRTNTYTDVDKNGKPMPYENVQNSGHERDLADMYAVPDKKPSTAKKLPSIGSKPPGIGSKLPSIGSKPPSIGSKPSSRGSSAGPPEPVDVDLMYAVPEKKPSYVNQQGSREGSSGPNEYADISDPRPAIPKKSAQLEEYLETKPLPGFTHSGNEYDDIESVKKQKASTLQALKKPLNSAAMSDNPLYDMSAVRRTNTISHTPNILSDNVYADPIHPTPVPEQDRDSERIYETIYSEAIQPSSFSTSSGAPGVEPTEEILCPFSSIYALPTSPLPAEEKPLIVGPDNIEHVQNLGTGNFGNVILAKTVGLSLKQLKMSKVDDDRNVKVYVAVKNLKEKASSTMREAFEKEYKFMSRLNHPSVIRLLGIHMGESPFIMMEYMEKGDLNQYLKNFDIVVSGMTHKKKSISTGTLVNICTQIASGMEYLAHKNFVHRDLATRNCLVGQNNVVKIADFGMSRNLYESHYYIIKGHAILPIRWMSTECFYGKFSAKSDVWAFGVTMWEIFSLAKEEPYSEMNDAELVEDAVRGAERTLLTRPEACPVDVFRAMEECWIYEPNERATFEDVFSQLSSLNFKYSSH